MASEKTPVVWDDTAKKHRPLGSGEKMGGLSASSMISSDLGNLIQQGSDGLMLVTGGSLADPRADNLLEESANGKLQVTSDRLAEWLDGHPQAAAAIADAVKVVSEDSGNAITQGSDNGAYLSGGTIADIVANMSSSQMSDLLSVYADGQTIVVSGGKLVVDPTTAPKAKLQKISAALAKAGAGLAVDSATGKLIVDFASMNPAIMRNVVLSMVQDGGGLAVDSNGQLYVDFENMPTDKFENLLKQLRVPIWLDSAMTFYVATNGVDDATEEGRGLSSGKPFATIGYAVQYVCDTYNMSRFRATIRVAAGDYGTGRVILPSYSATTGIVRIEGATGSPADVKCGDFLLRDAVEYEIYSLTARVGEVSVGANAPFTATAGTINLRNVIADVSETNFTGGQLWACYATSYGSVRIWAARDTGGIPTGMTYKYGDREWTDATHPSGVGAQPSGMFFATESGTINFAADITLIGSTTWHTACVHAQRLSQILSSYSSYDNPGRSPLIDSTGYTIGGLRYKCDVLSIISARTSSDNPTDLTTGELYYPGSVAGTTSGDGQYTIGYYGSSGE